MANACIEKYNFLFSPNTENILNSKNSGLLPIVLVVNKAYKTKQMLPQ